jgi:hypothetical protein
MIYHFYHCFSGGSWFNPLKEHINSLVESNLYENINEFFIGFVGDKNRINESIQYLNSRKIKFSICAQEDEGFEQLTHQAMYNFSKENDGNVLYAHTKGSYNVDPERDQWRKNMTKYNVNYWRKNIQLLQRYDSVGWDLRSVKYVFYAGNFWWTKLSVIRRLDPPSHDDRWSAEYWLYLRDKSLNMYSW